jgi:hypothetical protein
MNFLSKNKKILFSLTLLGLFLFTSPVLADSAELTSPISAKTFCELLTQIATAVGALVASLGTIFIIWSGILYLTSAGSPEKINKAKTALTYAIIGIVVGVLATTIVEVIKNVLSASGMKC